MTTTRKKAPAPRDPAKTDPKEHALKTIGAARDELRGIAARRGKAEEVLELAKESHKKLEAEYQVKLGELLRALDWDRPPDSKKEPLFAKPPAPAAGKKKGKKKAVAKKKTKTGKKKRPTIALDHFGNPKPDHVISAGEMVAAFGQVVADKLTGAGFGTHAAVREHQGVFVCLDPKEQQLVDGVLGAWDRAEADAAAQESATANGEPGPKPEGASPGRQTQVTTTQLEGIREAFGNANGAPPVIERAGVFLTPLYEDAEYLECDVLVRQHDWLAAAWPTPKDDDQKEKKGTTLESAGVVYIVTGTTWEFTTEQVPGQKVPG